MKILITGDLAITQPYNTSALIDQSLKDLFTSSDINIVNLEVPVTESISKILKTGPNLKAHRQSIAEIFKMLHVKVATLANNHLMDYDEQGVADTLAFCKEEKVQTVGGGMNLEEASKTLYLDTEEGKIAVVNFAENEWIPATTTSAGANPMDIIDNANLIKHAKLNAEFVFVIVHGGHEYYNLPSPRMQKQYRFYAEQGADIVIGHHTHCMSGNEVYMGVPIYYSLGNFIFTEQSTYSDWYIGLVLEVEIQKGKLLTQLNPMKQQEKTFELSLLKNDEKQEVLDRILLYSAIIADELKLKQEWNNFIESKYDDYLNYWSPFSFISNRYIKGLFIKMGIKGMNKKGMALTLNLIRCESHADMSKEVIKKYLMK
jgi:poly-gamma-glutamate capsule biosynthesis protein CapA/YwtB (metallophosphatase superfamily)